MRTFRLSIGLIAIALGCGPAAIPAQAADTPVVTAVYSSVTNGYIRTKLPDGTFKKEYYALARGHYSPGLAKDHSIDDMAFPTVSGVVAGYLARQGYYMAQDSKSAELLLLLTWGTTQPVNPVTTTMAQDDLAAAMASTNQTNLKSGQANGWISRLLQSGGGGDPSGNAAASSFDAKLDMELLKMRSANAMRLKADEENARLLGYSRVISDQDNISRFAGNGNTYDELISDIEEERYYVIVTAYDFKAATRENKQKPLWSTRVSIRVRGNHFDERLAEMIAQASRYFGKDSAGLVREETSGGTTTIRELNILGTVPEAELSSPPRQPDPEKSR